MNGKDILIKCENLKVSYGSEVVLNGVSFSLPPHSFLPIVGANGAGKTTLIKVLLGLKKVDSGKLITPFSRFPPAFVPQIKKVDLLYPVKVRQIIEMGLYPKLGFWKRPTSKMKERVNQILRWLKLENLANKNFSELSGGQRQKVLIARALVLDTEVIIMDEPNTGLDEDTEKELMGYLYRLWKDEKKTIIFVLHDTYLLKGLEFPFYLKLEKGKSQIKSGKELK